MTRADVEAALDTQFSTHSVARRLHAVPPHEVYEVHVDGRRGVCFLESLYVQNQHGPAETARRAASLREAVDETVEELEREG